MRNKTELMEQILTSPEAQKIIDYVSPVYGESYVMLWLFQVIGVVLDDAASFPGKFLTEVTPATARWTLDLWEKEYKIAKNPALTIEQRQNNLLLKIGSRYPANPKKLKDIVTNISGYPTEIIENVAKNTFRIIIRGYVFDLTAIRNAIDINKPAHLIYEILRSELVKPDLNMHCGTCVSVHEKYELQVMNS